MNFIIELLVNAAIILLLAKLVPDIRITSFGKAILVCLVLGFLNATIGFLLRLPLNILTLGLISFLVRLVVTTVMIRLTAAMSRSFEVRTWTAAFILAVCTALAGVWLHSNL
jgi:putative membrane protein